MHSVFGKSQRYQKTSLLSFVLVVLSSMLSSPAGAGVRDQCSVEIQRLCDPSQDSTAMIFQCLNTNSQALSPVCYNYISRVVSAQRNSMAFRDACSQEYRAFCPPTNGFKIAAAQKCLDVVRDRLTPICVNAYDQYFSFLKTGNSGIALAEQAPQADPYNSNPNGAVGQQSAELGLADQQQGQPSQNGYYAAGAAAAAGVAGAYAAVPGAMAARAGDMAAKSKGYQNIAAGYVDQARDLRAGGVAGIKKKALGGALAKAGLGDDIPGVGSMMDGDVSGALGGAKGAVLGKVKDKRGDLQKMAMGKVGDMAGGKLGGVAGKMGGFAGKAKGLMAFAGSKKKDKGDDDGFDLDDEDDEDSTPKKANKKTKKKVAKGKPGAGLIGTFIGDDF